MFKKAGKRQVCQDPGTLFPIQELCTTLCKPKVNSKLWVDLSDVAKARELGLQGLQKLFVKRFFLLINLADKVVQAKASASVRMLIADVYASTIDAVTMLGAVHMRRASPANRADSILSPFMGA